MEHGDLGDESSIGERLGRSAAAHGDIPDPDRPVTLWGRLRRRALARWPVLVTVGITIFGIGWALGSPQRLVELVAIVVGFLVVALLAGDDDVSTDRRGDRQRGQAGRPPVDGDAQRDRGRNPTT